MKASINGPNRRRNRVGDQTIASNLTLDQPPTKPLATQSTSTSSTSSSTRTGISDCDTNVLRFRIQSLESYWEKHANNSDARYNNPHDIGTSCLFTKKKGKRKSHCCKGEGEQEIQKREEGEGSGERLVQQHLQRTQSSLILDSDPILIHFHDLPIFVLSALPIEGSFLDDDDDIEEDILYMSQVHCHNHKICGTCN